ncbi:hypothetical protein [Actinokineospora enzanensis]|uniref:hypothetical protein n=1 Tax=Actinokineospora enzanensis TaxID=155975 RepID=UPI00036B1F9B|nr:hypothetical protein [Actinokineospora enzanensis]
MAIPETSSEASAFFMSLAVQHAKLMAGWEQLQPKTIAGTDGEPTTPFDEETAKRLKDAGEEWLAALYLLHGGYNTASFGEQNALREARANGQSYQQLPQPAPGQARPVAPYANGQQQRVPEHAW